jgi:hypothetical protein
MKGEPMEWNVQREEISAADTAEVLHRIARQLEAGALDVDGTPIRVTGPMTVSIELDASHVVAHAVVNVWCRRDVPPASMMTRRRQA